MIGKTISHYKILSEIGSGGMGVVYKAEDKNLKRHVALKFLPPELTRDNEARERFIHEAQSASALDHPNVCTVHEIGKTDDNQMFIAMGYYEGETLKDKIAGVGAKGPSPTLGPSPIKVDEALDVAIQIATGLEKAHKKNIVHRDIKPANIFITNDKLIKILDFGIAKLSGQTKLTKDKNTLGTVAYMSPEQSTGDELDSRSDIWSLGVVLFEMITGKLPFKGEYEQAVMYSIINDEPEMDVLTPELKEIISRALTKEKEKRYQHIEELLEDIKNIVLQKEKQATATYKEESKKKPIYFVIGIIIILAVVTMIFFYPFKDRSPSVNSLAVLPFMNVKNNVEIDYLGFALAVDIIADLSYLHNLSVRPASSVLKYHRKVYDHLEASEELNVNYVLTGNYQIEEGEIRLHVELIRVSTNETIWRDEIKEKYDDVFGIQDLVTENVIDGLKINFSSDERKRMVTDIPNNSTAYDYYQLSLVKPSTTNGNLEAIALLEKSIEYDSTYAPAFNQLGFRLHSLTSYNMKGIRKLDEAEFALNKALQINSELLSALGNLGRIYAETGKFMEAQRLVRKMLAINQNSAFAHFVQGYIYRYAGLLDEARREMEKALSLDPSDNRFRSLGITYYYLGEYDKALRAFDIDKGSWYALTYQGITFLQMGKDTIAGEYFASVIDMDPESFSAYLSTGLKASIDGKTIAGLQALQAIEKGNLTDSDMWYFTSTAYAFLGDKDGTLRAITAAVERGFYVLPFLEKYSNFDFVRDEPEFQKILETAKEKHEGFGKILLSEQ